METTIDAAPDKTKQQDTRPHRIVVVGGGAGGLELVTRLGDQLGKAGNAQVTLVDREATHLWKPLLHEVAAGSMDPNAHQLEYIAQARWHHFEFQQGEMRDLDRVNKTLTVAAVFDQDQDPILPERQIPYDTLVLAIGSVTNFFGIPGAAEHAMAIDTVRQAEHVRRKILAACMRSQMRLAESGGQERQRVNLVVIGGGATGVELAAELRNTARVFAAYGLHRLNPLDDITITLVEAGPRILPPLPERIATETARLLGDLRVKILTGDKVTEVTPEAVLTGSGRSLSSDLTVWAGGIKVPAVLGRVGLPTNHIGQVIVSPTLQSITDPDIFALGDCASCPWPATGKSVPPRAQAAHQQASLLVNSLKRRLAGRSLPTFTYRDHGSLISLGHYETVGNLMGRLVGSSVKIQGFLARLLYLSLYRHHQLALHGFLRMALDAFAQWLRQRTTPRVKLH
jgi:NADH dehydrogenase